MPLVAEAQTGGIIRDLNNETVLRQNFHNALTVGTVITSAFDTTATSKFVSVPGVNTSTSIVKAFPYGYAAADSASALYAYVAGTDSVYVTRNGTLKESQLKFVVQVIKF
jgi:hypothetical protein